ncbi:MAG: transglycosylase SLT domain-containing protein [Spirochaetaceae bacterium]|nr:transglycosylase SLT domain-containing protein [Spirochaetaceae bacterium]
MAVLVVSVGGIGVFALSLGRQPEPNLTVRDKPEEIQAPVTVDMPASSVLTSRKRQDIILEFYRDPYFKDDVVEFFTSITDSRVLASVILAQAEAYNIPPALAFALCWEESQYLVRAISKKNANGSIDRGLFQLNNFSFPQLKDADFFNPETNARHGMAHLRWCLDTAGSELAGLAMYNAGANRVTSNQTPKRTLDYVSRILEMRNRMEDAFRVEYFLKEGLPVSPDPVRAAASEKKSELVRIAFFPYR